VIQADACLVEQLRVAGLPEPEHVDIPGRARVDVADR
jgi:hypothetical protein